MIYECTFLFIKYRGEITQTGETRYLDWGEITWGEVALRRHQYEPFYLHYCTGSYYLTNSMAKTVKFLVVDSGAFIKNAPIGVCTGILI